MNRNLAERETSISFSKEAIANAIDKLLNQSVGIYSLKEENKIFGTYRVIHLSGTLGCSFSITLNSTDTQITTFHITSTNLAGSKMSDALLQKRIDDFLSLLSQVLQGQDLNREDIKQKAGGCMVIILFGIGTILTYLLR